MTKILVTGATGFIGSHLINRLLELKHQVVATSIDSVQKAKSYPWFEKVKYISQDLNEKLPDYFTHFGEPDTVIHLAWEGLPNYKASFHLERNLPSNYNFLKNLLENGLKNLAVLGTCFEYGMQEGSLNEEMPVNPANPYALAKDKLRKQLQELQREYDFQLKWFRLFYVYGVGQNPNSLLSSLDRALENGDEEFNMSPGDQVRDFIPVKEAVDIIARISLLDKDSGIVNCCSGNPVTVKEMILKTLKEKGKSIKLNPGHYPYSDLEPFSFWGDRKKMDSLLG